jgi:SAM-dependent methyltransferase
VQSSIDFIGQDHDYFVRVKAAHLVSVVRRNMGEPAGLSVLDVGCGVGLTDSYLVPQFSRVCGVDISEDEIKVAARNNPGVTYTVYEGSSLPFSDGEFDATFAVCVLHHVPPDAWGRFVREMSRVTSPTGLVIVFEHNPYNPLTRLAVYRCAFDEGVVLLRRKRLEELFMAQGLDVAEEAYVVLLPWELPFSARLESLLAGLPLGAQYFVAGRRAAAGSPTGPGSRGKGPTATG